MSRSITFNTLPENTKRFNCTEWVVSVLVEDGSGQGEREEGFGDKKRLLFNSRDAVESDNLI